MSASSSNSAETKNTDVSNCEKQSSEEKETSKGEEVVVEPEAKVDENK